MVPVDGVFNVNPKHVIENDDIVPLKKFGNVTMSTIKPMEQTL